MENDPSKKLNWKEAVWQASKRLKAKRKAITRQALIDQELQTIIQQVESKGATPAQTLSRVLQELRDDGVLIFDSRGQYSISYGIEDDNVETAIATEAQRLQACRIGQGSFRRKLEQRWNGSCPLTNISERALLRASHIIPWNRCESAAERLSVDNGLLLSALWDAAFDKGLVAFDDDGAAMLATHMEKNAEQTLRQSARMALPYVNTSMRERLQRHRMLHASMGLRRVNQ